MARYVSEDTGKETKKVMQVTTQLCKGISHLVV